MIPPRYKEADINDNYAQMGSIDWLPAFIPYIKKMFAKMTDNVSDNLVGKNNPVSKINQVKAFTEEPLTDILSDAIKNKKYYDSINKKFDISKWMDTLTHLNK